MCFRLAGPRSANSASLIGFDARGHELIVLWAAIEERIAPQFRESLHRFSSFLLADYLSGSVCHSVFHDGNSSSGDQSGNRKHEWKPVKRKVRGARVKSAIRKVLVRDRTRAGNWLVYVLVCKLLV